MKAYSIMLFLFILGSVSGFVNEVALFDAALPVSASHAVTAGEVTELTQTVADSGLNPLFMFFVIVTFIKVLASGLIAVATILPLLLGYGVPAALAVAIQGPIWIVELFGIYQLITGYNMQGME
jgi:hypothetical protein